MEIWRNGRKRKKEIARLRMKEQRKKSKKIFKLDQRNKTCLKGGLVD